MESVGIRLLCKAHKLFDKSFLDIRLNEEYEN